MKYNRILLIWIGRLGDLIVALPFIEALKKKHPEAKITLLVRDYVKEAAQMANLADDIVLLPVMLNPWRFIKNFLFKKFDLCIDLNSSYSRIAGFYSLLSRAKKRVSFKKFRSSRFYTDVIDEAKENEHVISRYKRLAKYFDAPVKDKFIYDIDVKYEKPALELFNALGLKKDSFKIAVHPGNFKKYNHRWPGSKFASLNELLLQESNTEITYLYGPGEKEKTLEIIKKTKGGEKIKLLPPASFEVWCKALTYFDMFILNTTGTMHVLWTLNKPMVATHTGYSYTCWRHDGNNIENVNSGDHITCRIIEVERMFEAYKKLRAKITADKK